MGARIAVGVLAVALVVGAPSLAHADDAKELGKRAVALAEEGRKAGDVGKIAEAIALFKKAFALDPRPEYQCGIGIAYADRQELPQAHLFIGRCINRTASAQRKQQLRGFHESLEQDMKSKGFVPVDITVRPAGATVHVSFFAADEIVPAPVQVWLPAGEYTALMEAPGHESASRTFRVDSGQAIVRVNAELQVTPTAEVPEVRTDEPEPIVDEPATTPVAAVRTPRKTSKLPIVLFSAAGAAVVGGAIFHGFAVSNIESIRGDGSSDERTSTVSTIKTQRTLAIGLYAAGAIVAGAGLYLRMGQRGPAESSVDISLAPVGGDGALVTVGWRR